MRNWFSYDLCTCVYLKCCLNYEVNSLNLNGYNTCIKNFNSLQNNYFNATCAFSFNHDDSGSKLNTGRKYMV